MNDNLPPEGYACFISGQYFKIGKFNKVFVFRNDAWVSTLCTTLKEVYKAIEMNESDITQPKPGYRDYVTHGSVNKRRK